MSNSAFPAAKDTFVNPTGSTFETAHAEQHAVANDAIAALEDKVGITSSPDASSLDFRTAGIASGWYSVTDTWTFASADAPTFVVTVPSNAALTYSPGMRVRLTQSSTVAYYIITAVTSTSLTLYGGTDYVLANSAISAVSFSNVKAPIGFPLDPTKWTVRVVDISDRTQASPTANTWYNVGSLTFTLPIGIWVASYQGSLYVNKSAATIVEVRSTLSTTSNGESDSEMSAFAETDGASGTLTVIQTVSRRKTLVLAAKTQYYLNVRTTTASVGNIGIVAATGGKTILEGLCAYL